MHSTAGVTHWICTNTSAMQCAWNTVYCYNATPETMLVRFTFQSSRGWKVWHRQHAGIMTAAHKYVYGADFTDKMLADSSLFLSSFFSIILSFFSYALVNLSILWMNIGLDIVTANHRKHPRCWCLGLAAADNFCCTLLGFVAGSFQLPRSKIMFFLGIHWNKEQKNAWQLAEHIVRNLLCKNCTTLCRLAANGVAEIAPYVLKIQWKLWGEDMLFLLLLPGSLWSGKTGLGKKGHIPTSLENGPDLQYFSLAWVL